MAGSSYFDKAMRSKDRRFARILTRLGHGPDVDEVAIEPAKSEDREPDIRDRRGKRNKYDTRQMKAEG